MIYLLIIALQNKDVSGSDRFVWTSITSLLDSGKLDPENSDVVQKLSISYLNSNKTGNEQKPVFGVRELEEGHFIFSTSTVQQTQNEIINYMQNLSSNDNLKNVPPNSNRSRHSSGSRGETCDQENKSFEIPSVGEAYVSLPEIPKGVISLRIV